MPILDLKPDNILLMDFSQQKDMRSFAQEYEKKIHAWGGIGFFLGGIGPEGHIAFNMRGSSHDSTTHLVHLNYESAASAAVGFGGIEFTRNKQALTIGLKTITNKKDATIIIIASGQGKAPVVADAIEKEKSTMYPASILHGIENARFYISKGAASQLHARRLQDIKNIPDIQQFPTIINEILTEVSVACDKPILLLEKKDLLKLPVGALLLEKSKNNIAAILEKSHSWFKESVERGLQLPKRGTLLHTAPHHDDVMLSYHPVAVSLLHATKNYFAYLTSGFNSVTNLYIKNLLGSLNTDFLQKNERDIFGDYSTLLKNFTQAYKNNDDNKMSQVESVIFAQKLSHIFEKKSISELSTLISWLLNSYFKDIKPGEKDSEQVQQLKGQMRESEVDRMWHIHGISLDYIFHMRAHFYTGDYFTPQPTFQYDVTPVLNLFKQHKPHIITVAFDPEGTGPNTHYKVLQTVAQAVKHWQKDGLQPTVWGYRNVWFRFKPSEANLMVPVSDRELDRLDSEFLACFSTQKEASFPSPLFDGPFSNLSIKIQKEQLKTMRTLLGDNFFKNHPNERVKNAAGLLFLKQMDTDEFLSGAQMLKEQTELSDL